MFMYRYFMNKNWLYVARLALLATALLPCIYSTQVVFPAIVPRGVFFLICTAIVWFGTMVAYLQGKISLRVTWFSIIVAALMIFGCIATIVSPDPYTSIWSKLNRMEGLIFWVALLSFIPISGVLLDQQWRLRFLKVWFTSSTFSTFVAFVQYAGGHTHDVEGRIGGLFGSPVFFASCMLISIGTGVVLMLHSKQYATRLLLGCITILHVCGLYISGTRSALLGLLVGLVAGGILFVIRYRDNKSIIRSVIWSFLFGLLCLVTSVYLHTHNIVEISLAKRFEVLTLANIQEQTRFYLYRAAMSGIEDRPIFGYGFDYFDQVAEQHIDPKYFSPKDKVYVPEWWHDRAHNIFFDVAINIGIVGALLYISMFMYALYALIRYQHFERKEALVWYICIIAYLVHYTFNFPTVTDLLGLFVLFGYVSIGCPVLKTVSYSKKKLLYRDIVLLLCISMVTVSLMYIAYIRWDTAKNIRDIVNSTKEYSLERIRKYTILAQDVTIDTPYILREIFYESSQSQAEVHISNSEQLELHKILLESENSLAKLTPLSSKDLYYLGVAYGYTGSVNDAARTFEAARIMAPRRPQILNALAEMYFREGDANKAREYVSLSYALEPTLDDTVLLQATALVYDKRSIDADTLLREQFNTVYVIHYPLINAYIETKMYERAQKILESAVKKYPHEEGYLRLSLKLYKNIGDDEKVEQIRTQIKKITE